MGESLLTQDNVNSLYSRLFERHVTKFPGCLPVSVKRSDIKTVLPLGYTVSQKADGERVFVLFDHNKVVFIHRGGLLDMMHVAGDSHNLYLFDGELLQDGRVLLFDTLIFNGRKTIHKCYSVRVELLRYFVKTGSCRSEGQDLHGVHVHMLALQYPTNIVLTGVSYCPTITRRGQPVQYQFLAKPIFLYTHTWRLDQSGGFTFDGLVFTKLKSSYEPFRCSTTNNMKWKPVPTLDFLLHHRKPSDRLSYVGGVDAMYRTDRESDEVVLLTTPAHVQNPLIFAFTSLKQGNKDMFGHVWECRWWKDRWEPIGRRADKHEPNRIDTVVKTIQNLTEDVRLEEFHLST
jgi:hypothetical protein